MATASSTRSAMLARIRKATSRRGPVTSELWRPTQAPSLDVFRDRFEHHLAAGGEVHGSLRLVTSIALAVETVIEVLNAADVRSLVVGPSQLAGCIAGGLPSEIVSCDPRAVERADGALLEARLLCSETGSVGLAASDIGPRRAAYAPPTLVIVALEQALVGSLADALVRVGSDGEAYAVLVAGPSRTADVEKTVVIPAHGPRAVHLVVVCQSHSREDTAVPSVNMNWQANTAGTDPGQ